MGPELQATSRAARSGMELQAIPAWRGEFEAVFDRIVQEQAQAVVPGDDGMINAIEQATKFDFRHQRKCRKAGWPDLSA